MPWHAPRHRMDSKLYVDTALRQCVVQLAYFVLRLRHGHSVARHDDHLVRRREDRCGEQGGRSEEHTSELQSHLNLLCRLLLEKKKRKLTSSTHSHFNRLYRTPFHKITTYT